MAKLSDRQRKQIIAEYVEGDGKVSQRSPAKKYNVCLSTISKILSDEKAEQSVHIKKKRKKTDREDAHFPPSRRNRCGRRARFSAIRISLFQKYNGTERGAARFLPLQATASAVHNFCRRSVSCKEVICGGTANSSSNLIGRRSRFSAVHKFFL